MSQKKSCLICTSTVLPCSSWTVQKNKANWAANYSKIFKEESRIRSPWTKEVDTHHPFLQFESCPCQGFKHFEVSKESTVPIEEIVGSSVVGPSGNHECWSFLAVNFRLPSLDSYPGVLKILLQRCYYCSSCGQFFLCCWLSASGLYTRWRCNVRVAFHDENNTTGLCNQRKS